MYSFGWGGLDPVCADDYDDVTLDDGGRCTAL